MKVDRTGVRSGRALRLLILILSNAFIVAEAADPKLVICVDNGPDPLVVLQAQAIAAQIFSRIGVGTKWYGYHGSCPVRRDKPIVIGMVSPVGDDDHPAALAYALPFERAHIAIFYSRVQRAVDPRKVPNLLAHVLVHEITHIIQATGQHSESGMMKARWDADDYFQMGRSPLEFTEEDLQLIRIGLLAWTKKQNPEQR